MDKEKNKDTRRRGCSCGNKVFHAIVSKKAGPTLMQDLAFCGTFNCIIKACEFFIFHFTTAPLRGFILYFRHRGKEYADSYLK